MIHILNKKHHPFGFVYKKNFFNVYYFYMTFGIKKCTRFFKYASKKYSLFNDKYLLQFICFRPNSEEPKEWILFVIEKVNNVIDDALCDTWAVLKLSSRMSTTWKSNCYYLPNNHKYILPMVECHLFRFYWIQTRSILSVGTTELLFKLEFWDFLKGVNFLSHVEILAIYLKALTCNNDKDKNFQVKIKVSKFHK